MVTDHAASTSIKPVRLLHTSDWHLGHELFGHTREVEHDAFLAWLSDTLEQTQADALLVTGDIYDVANPSVPAQQRLYRFIAELRQRLPQLQIVIIGGNHDSALRIDLPGALVDADVHLIGGLPRHERVPDMERICIALKNADGIQAAWLAAVPFCRPSDLEADGLAGLYARVTTALAEKADGLPMVLSGHLHVAGGRGFRTVRTPPCYRGGGSRRNRPVRFTRLLCGPWPPPPPPDPEGGHADPLCGLAVPTLRRRTGVPAFCHAGRIRAHGRAPGHPAYSTPSRFHAYSRTGRSLTR
ncbi:MAG: exonuclease subunit SbcD [Acetobacter peroxydans]|nr:exonuclease subunit SbcD [Acetobacter peroxydans]